MKLFVVKLCAFLFIASCFLALNDRTTADLFVGAAGAKAVHRFDRTSGAFLGEFVTLGLDGPLDNLILPSGTTLFSSFNTDDMKHH